MKAFWTIANVSDLLLRCVSWIFIPIIVITTSVEVFARYVLHTPLQWAEEVITFSLLMVFVGAIPFGIANDLHVKVETLYEEFTSARKQIADAIGSLCGALFFCILAIGAGTEALGLLRREEYAEMTGLPLWPSATVVCAIALFCAVSLLIRAWKSLRIGHVL